MDLLQEIWIEAFTRQLLIDCPRLEATDAEHIGLALWREAGAHRRQHPALAARTWLAEVGFGHGKPQVETAYEAVAEAA